VELYGRVRHAVLVDGMSRPEAARIFGINRRTVEKMLRFSIPQGYRRDKAIRRPKLDAFIGIIDQILEADKLVPKSSGIRLSGLLKDCVPLIDTSYRLLGSG
jgi:hypothetical protein